MGTPTARRIVLTVTGLLAVSAIAILGPLLGSDVKAQAAPRACTCSPATLVVADKDTLLTAPFTYVVNCACGNVSCVVSVSNQSGNQMVCLKP